jgi:hypothetical protein
VIIVALLGVVSVGAFSYYGRSIPEGGEERPVVSAPVAEEVDTPPAPLGVTAIAKDDEGREFISNQLIVEFRPGVTEEDVLSVLEKIEGKMLAGYRPDSPLMLVSVADPGDGSLLLRAVEILRGDPRILRAEPNLLVDGLRTPVP